MNIGSRQSKHERHMRLRVLGTTAIVGILSVAATAASAQTAPQAAQAPGAVEEIVVTGSRVDRSGFVAPTPVTVVGEQELENAGVTNVADQLNKAPAFQGSQAPESVGTGSQRDPTANFVNLRGLGTNRTLVLVDGKRFVPNSASGVVDTNLIPFALVERTDVVTGGASAAYGSDAVAGVVNFIINHKFEGVKGSFQTGMTEFGDDRTATINLAAGHNFLDGRLNVSAALQYYNQGKIDVEGDHSWGDQDWKIVTNPTFTPTNGQYRLAIAPQTRFSVATNGGLIITAGPLKGIQFGPGGAPYAFNYGQDVGATYMVGGGNAGEILDDYTPLGSLGIHRTNFYGRVGYDITDDITASFEATVSGAYGHSRVTGSTDVGAGGQITITRDNAYLPASIAAMMDANKITSFKMGRLNPELGWIEPVTTTGVQRYVASLDGKFGDGWKWSAYFEDGRSRYYQVYTGNRNQTNWNFAVDAVKAPNGQIVCRSTLTNPTNGCIPADVFGNGALNTTSVASYVLQNPYSTTWASERAGGVNLSGEPISTWAGPVSVAVGAEWRHELTKTTADANSNLGIFRVGNIIDQIGQFSVAEGYAETVVPLAEDQEWAKSLEVNAAARLTSYSVSGNVWTWKIGATYEPIDTVRFRAARSRDIRAPNIVEFFQAPRLNSGGTVIDRATGIQYAPRTLTGGNTNLTPEQGDTTTYGVVWSPDGALHGLRASVDRWDISLNKAIGTISSQSTVDYCYAGNTALCSQIQRDASGAITLVASTYFNLGYIKTSGVDFELDYALPMPIESIGGDLDLRMLATWTEKYVASDGGANVLDLVGSLNNSQGVPLPDWKVSTRLSYDNGPVHTYLENQFIPRIALDATYTAADAPESLRFIRAMDWTNLSVSYDVWQRDTARVQLFATVNNLFNQDPPIVPNSGVQSVQTNSTLYDVLGRRYQVGVRFSY